LGIQNANFKIISQHKNYKWSVQSYEMDFYLGVHGSFYFVFTHG
jgi:hypothetical protein